MFVQYKALAFLPSERKESHDINVADPKAHKRNEYYYCQTSSMYTSNQTSGALLVCKCSIVKHDIFEIIISSKPSAANELLES